MLVSRFQNEIATVECDFDGGVDVVVNLFGGTIIATEGENGLSATSVQIKPYSEFASAHVANAEELTVAADTYTPVTNLATHAGLGLVKAVIGAGESKSIILYVAKAV